jgi:hypothetical protein
MDGRVQDPVREYLLDRFGVRYVDMITEDGPVRSLASPGDPATAASILRRVALSIDEHGSTSVAVVAHAGCAGNPISDEEQRRQLDESVDRLAGRFPTASVLGLWIGEDRTVEPVDPR